MVRYTGGDGFEEKIVQVNRVSKKTAGGNKIGFSVLVVVGDKNGRVGVGLGKAPAVQDAIRKGATYAKKHFISVPMVETTIPHEIYVKVGAAKVLLKPASKGTGVIAGGAVRAVVEAAGIRDILSKVLGTSNQASNVYATLEALKTLREVVPKEKEQPLKAAEPTKVLEEREVIKEPIATKRVATERKSGNDAKKRKTNQAKGKKR